MKDTVIAFGICADNVDPWGVGRIRVIIDDNMVPPVRTGMNIDKYLAQLDKKNEKENGTHAYVPWELGTGTHAPDPYVIEPFLPKHLNIIPKIGESVKIIYYKLGNDASQREYIAPHTSNYDKLKYDTVETARAFTSKTTYYPKPNNLRINGLIPDPTDIGIFGRNNSDVVLPENEVFIRAGQQDFANHKKNLRNALIQVSHFTQRKTTKTTTVTQDTSPVKQIYNMVEFLTTTSGKKILTTVYIYPLVGVDTKNYSNTATYLETYLIANDNPEVQINITGSTAGNISSFIQDFLNVLDFKGEISLDRSGNLMNKPANNPKVTYQLLDYRQPVNGVSPTEAYNLKLYQFRASPSNDTGVQAVQDVINSFSASDFGLRPLSNRPSKQTTQVDTEITENDPDYDESAVISGADKLFLLSWYNSKSLQNKIGKYGFSQDEMYLTLQKGTEAMVKGDTLLKLIMDLIDLILKHGHSTGVDPIGSLNKDAVDKISQIKELYALDAAVSKDLAGGAKILNQYIRLS